MHSVGSWPEYHRELCWLAVAVSDSASGAVGVCRRMADSLGRSEVRRCTGEPALDPSVQLATADPHMDLFCPVPCQNPFCACTVLPVQVRAWRAPPRSDAQRPSCSSLGHRSLHPAPGQGSSCRWQTILPVPSFLCALCVVVARSIWLLPPPEISGDRRGEPDLDGYRPAHPPNGKAHLRCVHRDPLSELIPAVSRLHH